MDVMGAMRARHSCRSFSGEPVDAALLRRLVEAAALAPSSHNTSPFRLHVATGRTRHRVGEAMAQTTVHVQEYVGVLPPEKVAAAARFYGEDLGGAPVVIAISVPSDVEGLDRLNTDLATGCAIENLLLAATAEGLASCGVTFSFWVREQLSEVLQVPPGRTIVCLVLIGYPAEEPEAPPHKMDIATFLD